MQRSYSVKIITMYFTFFYTIPMEFYNIQVPLVCWQYIETKLFSTSLLRLLAPAIIL